MSTEPIHATPRVAEQQARKVAEAVQKAWHHEHGTARTEIPVGVVATLADLPGDMADRNHTAQLLGFSPAQFRTFAVNTWTNVIRRRPEITHLIHPIIGWLFEDGDPDITDRAHAVAHAALRAGQLAVTGTDLRFTVDLLGEVVAAFRAPDAIRARGQFYTPPDVAQLLTEITGVTTPGALTDPMMGTGGLFRSAAERMRDNGQDPRTMRWIGCDIDEIAVACAAVNSMIWGLGTDIIFHVGNTLTEGWEARALTQREQLRALASDLTNVSDVLRLLKGHR